MSLQSQAITAPVSTPTTVPTSRRGVVAVLARLLMRSAQVEAEADAAERYWISVGRGL